MFISLTSCLISIYRTKLGWSESFSRKCSNSCRMLAICQQKAKEQQSKQYSEQKNYNNGKKAFMHYLIVHVGHVHLSQCQLQSVHSTGFLYLFHSLCSSGRSFTGYLPLIYHHRVTTLTLHPRIHTVPTTGTNTCNKYMYMYNPDTTPVTNTYTV